MTPDSLPSGYPWEGEQEVVFARGECSQQGDLWAHVGPASALTSGKPVPHSAAGGEGAVNQSFSLTIKVSARDGAGRQPGSRAHSPPHKSRALVRGFTRAALTQQRSSSNMAAPSEICAGPQLPQTHPPVLEAYHNIVNELICCMLHSVFLQ